MAAITPAMAQISVFIATPAENSAGVPLSTMVSFTFNAPLDTNTPFAETGYPINFNTDISLEIVGVQYSPDLSTIAFDVVHEPDADISWILLGAKGAGGTTLTRPFTLNYSTATSRGSSVVSGKAFNPFGSSFGAIVALSIERVEGTVLNSTVALEGVGNYSITNVRDGIYWPLAALDRNQDGLLNIENGDDLIGFYDPDHDGESDSIVVAGGNVTGIDIEFIDLFKRVPARDYLEQAATAALEVLPDAELMAVATFAEEFLTEGNSLYWRYQYYSPSQDIAIEVTASIMGTTVDPLAEQDRFFTTDMEQLPEGFINTDVAVSIAEANGGETFREQNPITLHSIVGLDFGWLATGIFHQHMWLIDYQSLDFESGNVNSLQVLVDMITGEVVSITTSGVDSYTDASSIIALGQSYPNPATETAAIDFTLNGSAHVSLAVYDTKGDVVATLIDEQMEEGEHTARLNTSAILPGIYYYRLQAGEKTIARKLVVYR